MQRKRLQSSLNRRLNRKFISSHPGAAALILVGSMTGSVAVLSHFTTPQWIAGLYLGVAGGAFWLWTAGTLTTFVRNGFERVAMLLRTGHVDRPDILIAAPAACATGGLVLFSIWSYSRLRSKSWSDLGLLVVAIVLVAGFFVAIFAAFAPQYLGMFRRLRLSG